MASDEYDDLHPVPNTPDEPAPEFAEPPVVRRWPTNGHHQTLASAHHIGAEEALLGAMLLKTEAIEAVLVAGLGAGDFSTVALGNVFVAAVACHERGELADPVTVGAQLRAMGLHTDLTDGLLTRLYGVAGPVAALPAYARLVADAAALRRLQSVGETISRLACEPAAEVGLATAKALELVERVAPPAQHLEPDDDLQAFLDSPEPEYDWVIEGLLERGDRVILTGQEGKGKSTLLRQMAVCSSSGIHPFTFEKVTPVRTMLVDLENSRSHVRRQLRPLRHQAPDYDGGMVPVIRPQGLDLLDPHDQAWLEQRVAANRPELVFIGPIYKMAAGDPNEEKTGKPVALFLDRLRTRYGFALVLEGHTPHAAGGAKRPERPYGWSGWMRWPEFGLFLSPEGFLRHWRGARDERAWPLVLMQGGTWPWEAADNTRVQTFARILEELSLAGGVLTSRELGEKIGIHHSTIARAIKANQGQYDEHVALVTEMGG